MIRRTVKLLKPANITLDDVFEHPYLLLSIIAICFSFIIYIIYNYYTSVTSDSILSNYSYYSKDPVKDPPIFTLKSADSTICQTRCKEDPLCDGMTYDTVSSTCVGVKNGVLLVNDPNYSAWIKPIVQKDPYMLKTVLSSFTDSPNSVKQVEIPSPSIIGQFTFALWINITDWYFNFEKWKHVAHKGTDVTTPISYTNWSDVVATFPEQCVGFWLAPYTNILRISVTTEEIKVIGAITYNDGNIITCNNGKCSITDELFNVSKDENTEAGDSRASINKSVEFIDVKDIPINNLYHIAVTFNGNLMEIYVNGGLHQVETLKGQPLFNNGNMYIKYDSSFNGIIYQLSYVPLYSLSTDINKFYGNKPNASVM
jgi:hypothetical protein